MTTHSSRAQTALQALTEIDPAMAALSLWCAHRDGTTGVAETTADTITYGPGFADLPLHEQTGLAAHHILHTSLRHSARMGDMRDRLGDRFDPALWTIATDAIVNEALLLAGYALPRPALRLTALLADAIGQIIPARQALSEWDAERLYLRLSGGTGSNGSAARAHAHATKQGFAPDLHPVPAEAGPDRIEAADWQTHVARAMEAGRIAGRGIGMVGRDLADLPQATIPWEIVLRGHLARALLPHPWPSHRRPARRYLAMEDAARHAGTPAPPFEPGLSRATPAPRIALALDMSGSVDDTRLALFLAEIQGIARRVMAEVWLIPFDDAADKPHRIDPARLTLTPALRRGGGTAFAPAIAMAARLQPSVAVILTDLDGDPGPAPRFPVLWAVPDDRGISPPPFGRVLSMAR